MALLTKHMFSFCTEAYGVLKDDPSEKACYIKYREGEKYIEYMMKKQCWYYGKWVVFEGASYAMTIEEPLLKLWYEGSLPPTTANVD